MVTTMFILDRTLNTSHILTANKNSQSAFWADTYTQEFDTGAESLEFSCYSHEGVKEGNFVAFFYNNQYKMFQITELEEVHKNGRLVAECYCETASLQLLNNYVRPFSGDMNCIQFFEHILNGTEWRIGKYSNSLKDKVMTINETKVESVWSLIEDYKDIFECEINVYVTYENGHVTGQFIDIFSEGGLGSATYKRFEYGKNVTGITKAKDLYDWCTGIIVDCDCDVSNTIISESQGYGFTKGAGDVILDDNANRIYNAGRTHVIGVYEGDETEPVEACINAWKELEKRKAPKFDYKVTTALTDEEYEEVRLGDTVYVVDHSYTPPLLLEARVGKLELSFTNRSENTCTLTNYKEIKSKLLDADYIKLTGTITDIVNAFFPITSEGIADGAIVDGKIETTYFQQITADIVSASIGAFEELYVGNMTVINADIEKLRADTAEIGVLKAQLAEIDTLVSGHLTSDNIQSMIITGDKFTVADAFIKDAMIDTVNAGKINAGKLNTSLVSIGSEDGSLTLNGSLQQFKDSSGKVRIQIGKDAQGNFTFCLFSQDGQGVLIDETGIKEGAIGDGLIVDDMVAEDANIDGGKLDISSVITQINNDSTLIKSSKIFLDEQNQSLEVAFDALKTKVETIEDITVDGDLSSVIEQVTSNTTNINIMQGQISSLISNTTITKEDGEVVQLKDEYNSMKSTIDSNTSKIGSLETTVDSVSSNQSTLEQDLNSFKSTVSSTYATKTQLDTTNSNVTTAQNTANSANTKADTNANSITTITTKQSSLEQSLDNFKTTVSATYATKAELEDIENGGLGADYVTKTEFEQTSQDFTFRISQGGGGNLLRNSNFIDAIDYKWDYWKFWGSCYQYTDFMLLYESFDGAMIIDNQSTTEGGGFYQEIYGIRPNTIYTLGALVGWSDNVKGVDIAVEFYDGTGTRIGTHFTYFENDLNNRQTSTFTTPANTYRVHVVFNHLGSTTGSSTHFIIQLPSLSEGYGGVWSPHINELYDGIVKIDKNGLTVSQVENKAVLDSQALKFYNGSVNYSRVEGGLFKFTDPNGTAVGRVGRSKWTGTENYLTSVACEYGHSVGLGAMYSATDTTYTDPMWIASKSGNTTTSSTYSEQGLNISNACIFGTTNFKYQSSDSGFGMKLGSWGTDSGTIMGIEQLNVGISMGTAFCHELDWNATNFVHTDCYSNINMNGYNIYNSTAIASLTAQTEYTSRLMSEGSNDFFTYSNVSYDQGEVRWCWKETVFTYAEADVDPVTDEWVYTGRNICYIELPIFMAENIQNDYHINISKMSWGDYRIIEKNPYYFTLESKEEDFAFTFEVVAKLIDSETTNTNSIVANGSIPTKATPVEKDDGFKGIEVPIEI